MQCKYYKLRNLLYESKLALKGLAGSEYIRKWRLIHKNVSLVFEHSPAISYFGMSSITLLPKAII